jgi:hypothetical protein
MTLMKVESVIIDHHSNCENYELENMVWTTKGFSVEHIIENGININKRHCVEYINGEMYINLEKLERAKLGTPMYYPENKYITLVVLDRSSVVILGDEVIVGLYKGQEISEGISEELTIEEWMIKKLLE